ncbi:hypothetical protein BZK31_12205 [Pseudomonas floridensis]|uniref:pectate lyase n=1 Tax=Pseudomonas floridensis TaxID=1958950 RepID=A0A1X0N7X7_9PSED|nr:pectate lyase [Pseudomonas floridensis]ORC59117.1 hypothetical protein BZK31_12205 [Pseudomonas floridensis]
MSIGLSPQPYQSPGPKLDFSALNGSGPQQSPLTEQGSDQSIDPGALLFNTGNQRNVSFGKPETNPLDPSTENTTSDDLMSVLQKFMDTITSMFQMLAKLISGQNQAEGQEQEQDPYENFENQGGLGTAPTGGDDGGYAPDATEGEGGGTPEASGGDSGYAPQASGGEGGGETTTNTGGEDGGTPWASGNGGGESSSVTHPSSGPTTAPGTEATPGGKTVKGPGTSGDTVVVDETIKVAAGQTYDGGGATFTASNKLGTGDQSENQKPLFELAEGATLKNVNLGENEADGVHVVAKNETPVTIENLHSANVGEDLITVKGEGGAKFTDLNILDSSAENADDKIIQLNANTHLNVNGFDAHDFGKLVRTNGETQFSDMAVSLSNVNASHGSSALVQSDSDNLKLTTNNVTMTDVKHAYDKLKPSTQHIEA